MKLLRRLVLVTLLIITGAALVFGQTYTRCWRPGISGFETEHARAVKLMSGYCREDLRALQVFITAKRFPGNPEPVLYIHTNFKPAGQENALKLAFSKSTLDTIFGGGEINITTLLDSVLENEGVAGAGRKYVAHASAYVDPAVYTIFSNIRIGTPRSSYLVSAAGGRRPLLEIKDAGGRVRRLTQVSPPPPAARVYVSEKLLGQPGQLTQLQRTHFSANQVELINVAQDRSTSATLNANVPEGVVRSMSEDVTRADFLEALRRNPTKAKFILGHISNGELYLSRDGAHRIALTEIERFASREDLSVGIIGCESAVTDSGIVASKFINSVTAAERFKDALRATNFLDFFQRFSSADIEVVIHESAVRWSQAQRKRRTEIRADMFETATIGKDRLLPGRHGVLTYTGSETSPAVHKAR